MVVCIVEFIANAEDVEYTVKSYLVDYTGPFQGYGTFAYKDGSTIIEKYDATMTKKSGNMLTFRGKGDYIKGTGKYEGTKETITFTGEYLTPYNEKTKGDIIVDASSNYTLAK